MIQKIRQKDKYIITHLHMVTCKKYGKIMSLLCSGHILVEYNVYFWFDVINLNEFWSLERQFLDKCLGTYDVLHLEHLKTVSGALGTADPLPVCCFRCQN